MKMKTLKLLLVVAVLVGFAALAPKAGAETAWIKWQHETLTDYSNNPLGVEIINEWRLQEAYPSYGACMVAIRGTVQGFCSALLLGIKGSCREDDTRVSASTVDVTATGSSRRVHTLEEFYCYPDTIDPRKK